MSHQQKDYYIESKENFSIKDNILPVINTHFSSEATSVPSTGEITSSAKYSNVKNRIYRDLYNSNNQINSNGSDSFSITSTYNTSNLYVEIATNNAEASNGNIRIKPVGGSGQYKLEYFKDTSTIPLLNKWEFKSINTITTTKPIARWFDGVNNNFWWGPNSSCVVTKGQTTWRYHSQLYYRSMKNTSGLNWPNGFYYRISNLGVTDDMVPPINGSRSVYSNTYKSYSAGPFGAFIYGVSEFGGNLIHNHTPSQNCPSLARTSPYVKVPYYTKNKGPQYQPSWAEAVSGEFRKANEPNIVTWEIANWVSGYGGRDDNYNSSTPTIPTLQAQDLIAGTGDPGSGSRGNPSRIYVDLRSKGGPRGGTIYYRKPVPIGTTINFWVVLNHPCHPDINKPNRCYFNIGKAYGPGYISTLPDENKYTVDEYAAPTYTSPTVTKQVITSTDINGYFNISDVKGTTYQNMDLYPNYFWLTDLKTGQKFNFVVRNGVSTYGAWAGVMIEDFQLPSINTRRFFEDQKWGTGNFSKKITLTYTGKDGVYNGYFPDNNESIITGKVPLPLQGQRIIPW